jgi:nucleoside-diphosphate-sugar epimerase
VKVAVLGATGRTGQLLVEELLRRRHEVRVLVRDPARLPAGSAAADVVTGDSRDSEALARLTEGVDAVASALGPTAKEPRLHQDTAVALVATMRHHGVARFVGISGAGIDVPGDRKSLRDRAISALIRLLGGAVVADKPAEYRVWAGSGTRWTLVRPPRLTDGPPTGAVEHDAHHSPRATRVRRADLAIFVADVLERDLYVRQAPFVAEGPRRFALSGSAAG